MPPIAPIQGVTEDPRQLMPQASLDPKSLDAPGAGPEKFSDQSLGLVRPYDNGQKCQLLAAAINLSKSLRDVRRIV